MTPATLLMSPTDGKASDASENMRCNIVTLSSVHEATSGSRAHQAFIKHFNKCVSASSVAPDRNLSLDVHTFVCGS